MPASGRRIRTRRDATGSHVGDGIFRSMTTLPDDKFLREHTMLLADSFNRVTGRLLASDPMTLYGAPFALVSHGIGADPLFNFANVRAQQLFGYDWARFVTLPSRLSARAPERDERARLLDRVSRQGFIEDYSGIRVRSDGSLFRIEGAIVWNVIDADGLLHGQAAMFSEIEDVQ